MASDGPGVLHLLASHRALLARHRPRLAELLDLAVASGLKETPLGAIVASSAGRFGTICLEAGPEFVVHDHDGATVSVVVMGLDGLLVIVAATLPDALPCLLARPQGTLPIVVVDEVDRPALTLAPIATYKAWWS